jgi:hypothetical protein
MINLMHYDSYLLCGHGMSDIFAVLRLQFQYMSPLDVVWVAILDQWSLEQRVLECSTDARDLQSKKVGEKFERRFMSFVYNNNRIT